MNGISGGELIIAEIGGTSVSKMKRFPKPYRVECRHSDAFVTVLRGECHYAFDNGVSFTVTEGDVLYLSKGSGYFMNVTVDAYDVIFTDFRFAADGLQALCPHGKLCPAHAVRFPLHPHWDFGDYAPDLRIFLSP